MIALAFSTQPYRDFYLVEYDLYLANESLPRSNNLMEVYLDAGQSPSLVSNTIDRVTEQLITPVGANLTIVNLAYLSTSDRCFADTRIISETLREILKHVSNKLFYTSIGIVTIFYTITFVLALRRQNPRIRALKRSLNVLNKFDSYPTTKSYPLTADSIVAIQSPPSPPLATSIVVSQQTTATTLNEGISSHQVKQMKKKSPNKPTEQQYEMSKFLNHDDSDDQNLPSPPITRKSIKTKKNSSEEAHVSLSEGTSDELQPSTDKSNGTKQVSFQVENRRHTPQKEQIKRASISTVSLDGDLAGNNDMYYKLPCPCSTTRQLLIKFHFARPSSKLSKWLCCYCIKKQRPMKHHSSMISQTEEETVNILPSPSTINHHPSTSQSETLRKQLHQHRLRQIRMASTFLIITVSFVLFYLPSVLNADRIMRSPIMIYYLFLCTHALNPIIYCFMNRSLRVYVLSMFHCCTKRKPGQTKGNPTFFDR